MIKNPMYRNGNKCTVICTDKPGPQPIVSYGDNGVIRSHCKNGDRWLGGGPDSVWDLVETPVKPMYDHIRVGTRVTVTPKNDHLEYTARFAGVTSAGKPMVFISTTTVDHVEMIS